MIGNAVNNRLYKVIYQSSKADYALNPHAIAKTN